MHPAIIIGTDHSMWTWLWGRYHVPQNAFLVYNEDGAGIQTLEYIGGAQAQRGQGFQSARVRWRRLP